MAMLREMVTALILVVVVATVVNGDITGRFPYRGSCMCIDGTSVKIRATACSQEAIGSANSGQCFKYNGYNVRCSLSKENYHSFQINYDGNQGWIDGVNLKLSKLGCL